MVKTERKPKIGIVGSGPGGLTSAMLLSSFGFDVTVFEKKVDVGGRNGYIQQDGFTFDVGPTFLQMLFLLEQVFAECGLKTADYFKTTKLTPMYKLHYSDAHIFMHDDTDKMRDELARVFGEDEAKGIDKFMEVEKVRFEKMYPCLQAPYLHTYNLLSKNMRRAIPHLSIGRSLIDVMGDYFTDERAKLAFTFQAKYLGMSPWSCPGAFAIMSYFEHAFGVYHVEGGLAQISHGMKKACIEKGVKFHFESSVEKIIVENGSAKGILVNGTEHTFDDVVINADFGYAATTLFEEGVLKKWSKKNVNKKEYSCSTFMFYFGLDYVPNLDHHTIVFAEDYKENLTDITEGKLSGENISFYLRNSSVTDKTVAPKGQSAMYTLVPVPNTKLGDDIDWEIEGPKMRDEVIALIEAKLGINVSGHIVTEKIITPNDWQVDFNVHFGAVFSLAHTLTQMLSFRPHNQFEEVHNCYLVGGGTHPGSGLPTIYESARISSKLLCKKYGFDYIEKPQEKK